MMSGAAGTVKASTSRKTSPLIRSQNSPSSWTSGHGRWSTALRSVVSMNAALTVNDSEASSERLMNDCVWRRCERPPTGSSAMLALPAGASAPTQYVTPSGVEAIWPVAMLSGGSDVPSRKKTSVSRNVGP